ncbi:glycine oxidase maturase GoxB [Fodinicurvata sp. EGI_FJ10296]|uniref:glycine oxidase maturase GoxB n=1 Tax=Fodinicurvata sp. EGI_FJ10296 TaxID=3231908 RepID=UPI003455116C
MTETAERVDVAVVGGGVAGAAACVAVARRGIRALWLAPERDRRVEPVGESLSPAAQPVLASLGLEDLLASPPHRPSNATFSAWGSAHLVERNAAIHLEGPGRVLDRGRFEDDLAAAADHVSDRRTWPLKTAAARDGLWHLSVVGSEGSRAIEARMVIDASGRSAVFGRQRADYCRTDQMVAACSILPHRDDSVQPTPATLIESAEHGWFYAALLPDGRLSVAWFSDPDLLPAGLSHDTTAWRNLLAGTAHVGRWIDDAGFSVETAPRLASAGVTRLEPAADAQSGWAAVGDAAAAFDPLSSHGITTALWTGARAGTAAADWLGGDGASLDAYAGAVRAGAQRFAEQRAAIYALERRFGHSPFWRRRQAPRTDR